MMTFLIIIAVVIFLWWSLVPSQNQRMGIGVPPSQPSFDEDPVVFHFTKYTKITNGYNSDDIQTGNSKIIVRENEILIEHLNNHSKLTILRKLPPNYYYGIQFVCNGKNVVIGFDDNIDVTSEKVTSEGEYRHREINGIRFIK